MYVCYLRFKVYVSIFDFVLHSERVTYVVSIRSSISSLSTLISLVPYSKISAVICVCDPLRGVICVHQYSVSFITFSLKLFVSGK